MEKQVLAERFVHVIPRSMGAIRFEMRKHIPKDLSLTQFRVLAQLGRGPQTVSELAESIGISLPAISRMLDYLEKRNLIERDQKKEDRRQVWVKLNQEGHEKVESLVHITEQNFINRFNDLSKEDSQKVLHALEILERLSHLTGDGSTAP